MNRVEYANAVYDLLGLDVDPAEYLPVDDSATDSGCYPKSVISVRPGAEGARSSDRWRR